MACWIRWTCRSIVGAAGNQRPVVIYTPLLLDRRSAFLLINTKLAAENSERYFCPRYDMPIFDFNRGMIQRIIIRNDGSDNGLDVQFSAGLDRIYDAIVNKKMPDKELANIRARASLLKHDLFLDYRHENIAETEHDAVRARGIATREAIIYSAKSKLDIILPFSKTQELKPWLDIEEGKTLYSIDHAFKNVYVHQKKFDAKVYTSLRQLRICSCYSPFIAAVYADAYIHKHMEAVSDPYSKLNFPDFRIPVKCCCPDCMTIERKRGPQPKIDKLYYLEEYLNDASK